MKTKRTFALLLALTLCFSLVLSSCDKLKKKDIENDPAGQVAQAARTVAENIGDNVSPLEVLKAAKEKGVVTLSLDNADLGLKLEGKSTYDTTAKRLSGAYALTAEDESVNVALDVSDSAVTLSSPELVKGVYGVDLTTLVEDLRDSGLVKAMDVDYDEIADRIDELTKFIKGEGGQNLTAACEKLESDVKATVNKAEHTVEKKEVTVGGETVEAYEVIFKLTKTDVSELLGVVKTDFKLFVEQSGILEYFKTTPYGSEKFDPEEFEKSITDVQDALEKDENDVSAQITFYLSPKTAELLYVASDFEAKSGEDVNKFDFTLDLGADPANSAKVTGVLNYTSDAASISDSGAVTFTLDRVNTDKEFSRRLAVEQTRKTEDNEAVTKYTVDFKNDKAAKTFVCSADSETSYSFGDYDYSNKMNMTVDGTLEYTATTLTATVGGYSVSYDGEEAAKFENIGLTLSLTAGGEIGAMPEYTNVAKLDFEGVTDLYIEIQNNAKKLTKIPAKFAEIGEKMDGAFSASDYDFGDDDSGMYIPDDFDLIYDEFDEKFDYNYDGEVNDDDRASWESEWRPFGSTFVEDFDYDADGKAGTDADREYYDEIMTMKNDSDASFDEIYAEFNEDYDYDGDGKTGTDADRADYDEYFKPFAEEFDPERDYDNDGVANEDDKYWYDYIRGN